MAEMSQAERREFVSFIKGSYVKSIKARGEAHAAQLALVCEEELSRLYDATDQAWNEVVAEANKKIDDVNAEIESAFAERGLTNKRRMPSMHAYWFERGETDNKERRAELRKVAEKQEKLMVKAAVAKAEEIAGEFQSRMLTEEWTPRDGARGGPRSARHPGVDAADESEATPRDRPTGAPERQAQVVPRVAPADAR